MNQPIPGVLLLNISEIILHACMNKQYTISPHSNTQIGSIFENFNENEQRKKSK